MRILILGAGKMGAAAAYDLLRCSDVERVTLADGDRRQLAAAAKWVSADNETRRRLKTARVDVSQRRDVLTAMRGHQVVLSAVPYFHNLELTQTAIAAGCHFCDLGGNTALVRKQLQLGRAAEKKRLAILPDCGLSPGLASVLGGAAVRELEEPKSLRIFIGGLPVKPIPPLNYKLVFSVEGLINEYVEPCRVLRAGKVTDLEPLTEVEPILFRGWPPLETMMTSGGTSTLPETFKGKLQTVEEKTVRYPGHTAVVKALKDLGFFSSKPLLFDGHKLSARQVSAHLLERGLTLPGDDAVLMRIVAQGREQSVIYEGDIRADTSRGLSAMMRTTALPAAICARFLGNGTITARGGLRQEVDVPAERLLEELAGRGVILNKTSQRVYAANAPNRLC